MRIGKSIVAGVSASLLLFASIVSANTIEVNFAGRTGTDFSYDVALTPTGVLASGNYFVIYDFAGFDTVVSNSTGFTFVGAYLTGTNGMLPTVGLPYDPSTNVQYQDNPALPNVVFQYTGATTLPDKVDSKFVYTDLGTVVLRSFYTNEGVGAVTSHDSGGPNGQNYSQFITTPAVPLPAAAWSGMGLLSVLGVARVRKAMR